MDSRPTDLFQPGDLVNNTYRIEKLLGRGGTSDVYKARSEISGRLVAIKALKAEFSGNDDYLVLLTREEEIREIRHEAVVRYSENHRTPDGHVYLLMDYVDGPGLDEKLKQGPMSADDLLTICRRVTEGLQAAHGRNIVHRDLSPDNIILRDGDPAQPVIIDFGIAKDTRPGAETIVGNEFAGKYSYAAPEQLSGNTDTRTDLYSLGALLLANFRGKRPDPGRNPMEVVENKAKPLDTSGVPEPLRSVIDKASHPDPDQRFQSAAELLAFLDNPGGGGAGTDFEETVVAPHTRPDLTKPDTQAEKAKGARPKPAPQSAPRKRGGLVAVLLVALLAAAGGAGFYMGLFDSLLGPAYPVAQPYTLIAEKPGSGLPVMEGHAPSEDGQAVLSTLMAELGGSADLSLATGEIPDSWVADVADTLTVLQPLDTWRLSVSGAQARVSGSTTDKSIHETVVAAFEPGLPGAMSGSVDVELINLFVAASTLAPVLKEWANCGPLEQVNPPVTGYGPQDDVTISGRVADTATRIQIFDALSDLLGDRKIELDLEVLNPTLCLLEKYLPDAPSGGIGVAYSEGGALTPNPSGRFFVGENPVIDILLPAEITDGYLTVSILDVSGSVFHLLPNLSRPENSVVSLRAGKQGDVSVRVTYPKSEAAPGKLAFEVNDTALGKSKVITLHSSEPLFEGLRPTEESAEGYAKALQDHSGGDNGRILSLDSRIIETAKP